MSHQMKKKRRTDKRISLVEISCISKSVKKYDRMNQWFILKNHSCTICIDAISLSHLDAIVFVVDFEINRIIPFRNLSFMIKRDFFDKYRQ
jgi:hypothetical protein